MLSNTKVGDKLLVDSNQTSGIYTVTHTTRTKVVCSHMAFRRDGSQFGADTWVRCQARPATAEDIAEHQERKRRNNLIRTMLDQTGNVNLLGKLSTEKLEQLVKVLG